MKAYKLFKLRKDGSISPLFINSKQRIPLNKWLKAESHRTKGFKYNKGWHCVPKKYAPHLSEKGRVWAEIKIKNYINFQKPKYQGGLWFLADKMIVKKILV